VTQPAEADDAEDSSMSRRTSPSEEILELESFLSYRVSILAKLLDRRLARLVGAQFGLAIAEYRTLAQIAMRPKSTVRAIAEQTLVDKAQISRAVAVLEGRGLVVRGLSGSDRRSPVFTTTRTGRAMMNRVIPVRQAQERELATYLGQAEVASVAETLQVLIDRLAGPAGGPGARDRSGKAVGGAT
jgi:DNA-binding MarR family transcriptional regulator